MSPNVLVWVYCLHIDCMPCDQSPRSQSKLLGERMWTLMQFSCHVRWAIEDVQPCPTINGSISNQRSDRSSWGADSFQESSKDIPKRHQRHVSKRDCLKIGSPKVDGWSSSSPVNLLFWGCIFHFQTVPRRWTSGAEVRVKGCHSPFQPSRIYWPAWHAKAMVKTCHKTHNHWGGAGPTTSREYLNWDILSIYTTANVSITIP